RCGWIGPPRGPLCEEGIYGSAAGGNGPEASAAVFQYVCHVLVTFLQRNVAGPLPVVPREGGVGSFGQQQLSEGSITVLRRLQQRREAAVAPRVDGRPSL